MGSKEDLTGTDFNLKGSIITLIGRERVNERTLYTAECSVCSHEDKELWPKGSIKTTLDRLRSGHHPCGCSRSCKYSDRQYEILVSRFLPVSKYTFKRILRKGFTVKAIVLDCSVCSKDSELFPEGSVTTTHYRMREGKVSCGCKSYNYSEDQYKILMKRLASNSGLTFTGWKYGYLKGKSQPTFEDCKGVEFTFAKLSSMYKKTSLSIDRKTSLSEVYTTCKGGTIKVVEVTDETKGNNRVLKVLCSVCHEDSELHNDYFTTTTSKLRSGSYPCACKGYKVWTEHEHRVRLKRRLDNIGWGLVEENITTPLSSKSYVQVFCDKGHCYSKSIDSILNAKSGCSKCFEGTNGHYLHRDSEPDNLYVINFNDEYIKVGRSFNVPERVRQFKTLLKMDNINVLCTATGTHANVYEVEQYIHEVLTKEGYYHSGSEWTTETFNKASTTRAFELIKNSILN